MVIIGGGVVLFVIIIGGVDVIERNIGVVVCGFIVVIFGNICFFLNGWLWL